MCKPSILFINRVFPPDRGATGRCLHDLAARFATRGWRVSVLACGAPDAPSDAPEGVSVTRAGDRVGGSGPNGVGYLSALHRLYRAASRIPRHDLVVTMTDPPMLAVLGPLLGRRWGCGVIHWSHDLYPDLLPVIGARLPRPVLSLLHRAATAALRRCDAVVAIGSCMADRLSGKGIPAQKIVTIPNWPDPVIHPIPRDGNPVRAALGLEGRFSVAYSGNFGLAHPLDAVLEAASVLAVTAPDVAVLLIGEGRGLPRVRRILERQAPPNLRLLPLQPSGTLAASLGAADLHLAVMDRRSEGMLVPSKVSGALAAGRPCILLGPSASAAARMLVENRCGAVLDPDDAEGLVSEILSHARDPVFHAAACERARATAALWSADRAADAFLNVAASAVRTVSRGETVRPPASRCMTAGG
ncbi:glycosyltransferase family 4 protein [Skermanella mucosa]|uniref:glycosyltransferase family 4 protein n=1 Tax=Skermanella mucosa TaxID=1789672 RepID=UPI00192C7ECB|nr:glycosyltransferase family 4 protein [Skermanella mucosa]UEM22948.1 glycosyltransferase family 4 protein [Skermanella mucosa]